MFLFSVFFVLLLAGVLIILWEFDHATRMHLDRGHPAKHKNNGIMSNAGSKPA